MMRDRLKNHVHMAKRVEHIVKTFCLGLQVLWRLKLCIRFYLHQECVCFQAVFKVGYLKNSFTVFQKAIILKSSSADKDRFVFSRRDVLLLLSGITELYLDSDVILIQILQFKLFSVIHLIDVKL